MAKRETDYWRAAGTDAARLALHYLDEIVQQIHKNGKASDDILNDYKNGSAAFDQYRRGDYSLREAADLFDALGDYEADDQGLWDGLGPKEAVSVMAAETYANAVGELWSGLIGRINTDVEENLKGFRASPKDWSPHLNSPGLDKLKKFVKDHIHADVED